MSFPSCPSPACGPPSSAFDVKCSDFGDREMERVERKKVQGSGDDRGPV